MIVATPALWLPPERPAIVRAASLDDVKRINRETDGIFPFPFFVPKTSALTPPTTNLWGWWSADYSYTETSGTPTTLITSDGTAIGSWFDRSGNGRHAYQTTAGQKPTYKTSIKNGLPAALFAAASSKYLSVGSAPTYNPTTVYIVFNMTTWAGSRCLIANTAVNPAHLIGTHTSANKLAQYNNSYGTDFENGTGWHLVYSRVNGTAGTARIDNNSNTSSTFSGGGSAGSTLQLGANTGNSFYWDDYICEMLLYTADHTDPTAGDSLLVRQYLNSRYALGLGI